MRLKSAVSVFLGLLVCREVSAQPVNTEVLRRDAEKPGVSLTAASSLSLQKGNVNILDITATAHLQYQDAHPERDGEDVTWFRHRAFINGNVRYAESNDRPFLDNHFIHTRWTAMWDRRVGTEVFLQHQANAFLRLRARSLAGAGVRFIAVHDADLSVYAGLGLMGEYELVSGTREELGEDPEQRNLRVTSYAGIRVRLFEERLLFQEIVYAQPRIDAWDDVRILSDTQISVPLSRRIALGFSFSIVWDSQPPRTVEGTDYRLMNTFQLNL